MAEIARAIIIKTEKTVCLSISNFMLSFLLSLTIALYNLNPLTAIAIIAGINIIFCSNNVDNVNINPPWIPIMLIQADIVYPSINPLYNINPKTIGSPITVVPKNHIILAIIILLIIVCFNNSTLFML